MAAVYLFIYYVLISYWSLLHTNDCFTISRESLNQKQNKQFKQESSSVPFIMIYLTLKDM